jgi:hypothetical protein
MRPEPVLLCQGVLLERGPAGPQTATVALEGNEYDSQPVTYTSTDYLALIAGVGQHERPSVLIDERTLPISQ